MSQIKKSPEGGVTVFTKLRQTLSGHALATFAFLVLSVIVYVISLATTYWTTSKDRFTIGIWSFCVNDQPWSCYPCRADFCMATMVFCILCILMYISSFVILICYLVFRVKDSSSCSRSLVIALCLLSFCIVSLQIMTLVVFGAKVHQYYYKLQKEFFPDRNEHLYFAWSFFLCILSAFLVTASGIFNIIEIKNIAFNGT